AGATVLDSEITGPDLALVSEGREFSPRPLGQFVTEADAWQIEGPGVGLQYRLLFEGADAQGVTLYVRRKLTPLTDGFAQELAVQSVPASSLLRLSVLSPQAAARAARSADGRTVHLGDRFSSRIVLQDPASAKFSEDGAGVLLAPDEKGTVRAVLHYQSDV